MSLNESLKELEDYFTEHEEKELQQGLYVAVSLTVIGSITAVMFADWARKQDNPQTARETLNTITTEAKQAIAGLHGDGKITAITDDAFEQINAVFSNALANVGR